MAEQSFLHCGKLLPVGTLMPEHHQECQLELALTNLHEEKLLDYKFSGSLEDNCSALQNTKTVNFYNFQWQHKLSDHYVPLAHRYSDQSGQKL